MLFAYFLQISNHMWLSPDDMPQPKWTMQDPWNENNNCDIAVFDRLVDCMEKRCMNGLVIDVGDGVKLDSHPEIAAPDAWSKEFLKKKLDEIRAKGIEPFPKMNFSCGHNVWMKKYRYLVGTPEYMQFCKDVASEVADLFGRPRLFHLGMDEEVTTWGSRVERNEKALWNFMYQMFDTVESKGARPWVFSDYYWHHPDLFEKHMPKSVVQSNWHYDVMDPRPTYKLVNRVTTYDKLNELGYDQIPVPSHFSNALNATQTMWYCKEHIDPEHLLGFNDIPWHNTTREEMYTHIADIDRFYMGRVENYPETLPEGHKVVL
ncbi:MAG: hypothetical protein IK088_01770 [Lachnospiraceae bacterium]|nr:hypothetical protein [Lachnospiraceae bacterium]